MIPSIIHDGKRNRFGELKWGLVPSWAKDEKIGYKMINARAETLMEKASFKHLIQRKRAIIPADGFYEWKVSGKGKQPMRITMKDEHIFSMAALYDMWTRPDDSKLSTCTIITTSPNELMSDIHDRMPVILDQDSEKDWLQLDFRNAKELLAMLKPYPSNEMITYPVSSMVGNVRNETKNCIVPIE